MLHCPEVTIRQIPEAEERLYSYTDLSDIEEKDWGPDYQATYYFECQQQHYKFRLSYGNVRGQPTILVHTFHNLLQQLGRTERSYEIDVQGVGGELEDVSSVLFVADRFKYPAMQQYLRLPSWEVV